MGKRGGIVQLFLGGLLCVLFVVPACRWLGVYGSRVVALDEDSWGAMLEGEWMVEFYAPWCSTCQQFGPVWDSFGGWSDDLGIKVAKVDVTTNPGLSGRFLIMTLPKIFHVKDGVFRPYLGSRSLEALMSFIEEQQWEKIEPVSMLRSPQGIPMTCVAQFFRLSMALRNIHNAMVDFGIPFWLSYAIFGAATIMIGAILGLCVVCILDYYSALRQGTSPRPIPVDTGELDAELLGETKTVASKTDSEEVGDSGERSFKGENTESDQLPEKYAKSREQGKVVEAYEEEKDVESVAEDDDGESGEENFGSEAEKQKSETGIAAVESHSPYVEEGDSEDEIQKDMAVRKRARGKQCEE